MQKYLFVRNFVVAQKITIKFEQILYCYGWGFKFYAKDSDLAHQTFRPKATFIIIQIKELSAIHFSVTQIDKTQAVGKQQVQTKYSLSSN